MTLATPMPAERDATTPAEREATGDEVVLRVEGLTKRYGERAAV
jgi:hypothetical protein